MQSPSVILITGASSGIGDALSKAYAAPGVTLLLIARSAERLTQVADACRDQGASVVAGTVDVTDRPGMADWITAADDRMPIDLVIANAGISGGTRGGPGGEGDAQVRDMFAVNVDGLLNTVLPVIPRMQSRRRGQIALMSSLAGYRGVAGAPAYCGSKAAVKAYGEGLRGSLAADGVEVSVICPGFVISPMTAVNDFRMPFLMPADRAARIIRRGLARNRSRIAFPWPMAALAWLNAALPPALTDPLINRLPRKRALSADGHSDERPTDDRPG